MRFPVGPTEIQPGLFLSKLQSGDDVSGFDCGHRDTNDFLKDDALEYQKQNLAVTYVLKDNAGKVIGFVSLAMGAIKTRDAPIVKIPGVEIHQYPCLKMGQLGVTKDRQGRNLGELLVLTSIKLADRLSRDVGCRFVQVDSYPEKIGFYDKYGFKPLFSKINGRRIIPMYLLLSIIRA